MRQRNHSIGVNVYAHEAEWVCFLGVAADSMLGFQAAQTSA